MTAAELKAVVTRPHFSRWARRIFMLLFLGLVAFLIFKQASTVEWEEVGRSIRSYRATTLAAAMALSALSYLIYSSYDLLGRYYIKAQLHARAVIGVAFVSYAFNQSLGSMIGAVGFRLRLYSRLGLDALRISKLILLSIATNWLGYSLVAGIVFVFGPIVLPPGWDIGHDVLRIAGIVMLCTAASYMLICTLSKRRQITIKKRSLRIPGWRLAALQLLLSTVHWPVEAAVIYVLFNGNADFATVLGALLLSSVAAVLTHIPGGLGVLEAVFVGLLRDRIPTAEILAALLVFRALYFILPLAVAALLYVRAETADRRTTG